MTNRIIYKYTLDGSETEVPLGDVLAIAFQNKKLIVWISHASNPQHKMTLVIKGTGWLFDDTNLKHVGSAVSDSFVWHVYRRYV